MSFGRHGSQGAVLLVEQRQVCDVGGHQASCTAYNRSQQVLERQCVREIVGRIDEEAETALADAAITDDMGDGIEMKTQPFDLLVGRSARRRVAHRLDQFGDVTVIRAGHGLFQNHRNN